MDLTQRINLPILMRIENGVLDEIGGLVREAGHRHVLVMRSAGLPESLPMRLRNTLQQEGIHIDAEWEVDDVSFENTQRLFTQLPATSDVIIAIGGGKVIDVAKYLAFLSRKPMCALPSALSNDGFCSPQSSLTMAGKRRSLESQLPSAVLIDTGVCLAAPTILWHSGVGDLVAKLTAVEDWKIAERETGTPVHDFAALICQTSVLQFLARPKRDEGGVKLLGTAFALSGVAMEICGSSRPASGSEHLISHALDGGASARPRLHGLQVGVATYLVSLLQNKNSDEIAYALDKTGFWDIIASDPFDRSEWLEAVKRAPSVKRNFCTILSTRDCLDEVEHLMHSDGRLAQCFSE